MQYIFASAVTSNEPALILKLMSSVVKFQVWRNFLDHGQCCHHTVWVHVLFTVSRAVALSTLALVTCETC